MSSSAIGPVLGATSTGVTADRWAFARAAQQAVFAAQTGQDTTDSTDTTDASGSSDQPEPGALPALKLLPGRPETQQFGPELLPNKPATDPSAMRLLPTLQPPQSTSATQATAATQGATATVASSAVVEEAATVLQFQHGLDTMRSVLDLTARARAAA